MDSLKPFLGVTVLFIGVMGALGTTHNTKQLQSNLPTISPKNADVRRFIKSEAVLALENHSDELATLISDSILTESERNHLDPLLLLAVTFHESHFNVLATGTHGEIGLMQIRPTTAHWIANKFHLPWDGAHTLINPIVNIQIGASYLAYLRNRFHNHREYFLTAYNMGPKHLNLALQDDLIPQDYKNKVDGYYKDFSSRYACFNKPSASCGRVISGVTALVAQAH